MNSETPIVLFDGICNFCNRMVNFAIRHDRKARLKFAALQSTAGKALVTQYAVAPTADTLVLVLEGKAYTYAKAAFRICRYLDWPVKALAIGILIPAFISQPLYKWFARNRYKWFGKRTACIVPGPEIRERFLD